MNKKLLLLPVILISSALSACAVKVEHVTLKDILDKKAYNYASLRVSRYSKKANAVVGDNDGSFFELLKTYTYEAEMVGLISNFQSAYDIDFINYTFDVNAGEKEMRYFDIRVYETGEVETYAGGTGNFFYPKEQYTAYKINKSDAKSLFDHAEDYARDYERDMAKREARIDNFVSACERNRINSFGLRIQTNEEPPRQFTYDVMDRNGTILDIFKDIHPADAHCNADTRDNRRVCRRKRNPSDKRNIRVASENFTRFQKDLRNVSKSRIGIYENREDGADEYDESRRKVRQSEPDNCKRNPRKRRYGSEEFNNRIYESVEIIEPAHCRADGDADD